MSLPSDTLSTLPHPAVMLAPDDAVRSTRIIDYERAGVGIQVTTQGINARNWTADLDGNNVNIFPTDNPEDSTTLFAVSGITHLSFAFDGNMKPMVAYIANAAAKLWWFDPVPNANVVLDLEPDALCPTLTMDDKRFGAGSYNDVLLFYIRANQLLYLQSRDRFRTERFLKSFPGNQLFIRRAGMNAGNRIQVEILGSDNYIDKPITYASTWLAAVYEGSSTSFITTLPANLTSTTFLLAFVIAQSTISPPAGWTLVTSQTCTDGTITQTLAVYRKNSTSSGESGISQTWGQSISSRIGVFYLGASHSTGAVPSVIAFSTIAINSTSTMTIPLPVLTATEYQELFLTAATSIVGTSSSVGPAPPLFSSLRSGSVSQTRLGVSLRTRYAKHSNSGTFIFPASVALNGLAAITLRVGV